MTPAPPEAPTRSLGSSLAIGGAVAVTLPGLIARLVGGDLPDFIGPVVFGLAIVGSAFLLAWAAEVLQLDVSQGLALTVLALIAVLPEYAVDFTFAWKAGQDPEKFAPLALANMTGSNRLLIGIGWSMVVLVAAWRMTRIARRSGYTGEIDTEVRLERPHAIEIAFLAIATLYSLTLPLKRTLTLVDAAILIAIFVVFVVRIARSPAEEPHLVGPAKLIATLTPNRRRTVVGALMIYAALAIFACRGAVRRVARAPWRASGYQHVPPRAVGRAARLGSAGAHRRRDVRVATPDECGLRHAAVLEGEPVDAARGLASDRVLDLRRPSVGTATRLTATRGAFPDRGPVRIRGSRCS